MAESQTIAISLLQDAYEQALDVAGPVWPTPELALASLFRRGLELLERGGDVGPIRGQAPPESLEALNRARDELLVMEAQYTFTGAVTFRLTQETDALERTWLALADEHLATRAEIVAARREEERIKRELAGLGAYTVPLPEHDDLPEPGPDRPRKSRGMYDRLFEGASIVEVRLALEAEVAGAAERLARREGWSEEWGEDAPLVILAHGLSLALREREADELDGNDPDSVVAALAAARRRTMGLAGRYATLRYRLFELRGGVRILGWRITALRVEARGMRVRLELFIRDRARLEGELAERRATAPAAPPEGVRSGLRRILERLLGPM